MGDLGKRDTATACGRPEAMPPSSVMQNESLHRLLKMTEQTFRQQALQQMRAQGIPDLFPGVMPLILHLGDEDGVTLSELARRCHLESSTLTPLVDELERHHIAVRTRDTEDRRVVRLLLTDYGRELEPRLRSIVLHLQDVAFAGIPETEIAAMRRVLERLIANLHAMGEA